MIEGLNDLIAYIQSNKINVIKEKTEILPQKRIKFVTDSDSSLFNILQDFDKFIYEGTGTANGSQHDLYFKYDFYKTV